MNDLALPGAFQRFTTMAQWCDAYSICIEVQAQAAHDPMMRAELNDASKRLRQEGDRRLAENQDAVTAAVRRITMDDYHEKAARWRTLRGIVIAAGWDLEQDIHFEQVLQPTPGVLVYQADERAKGLTFGGADGMMVCEFLEFVQQTSDQAADPRVYVQQMLLRQGINAGNFHEHADKLAIDNPWT